MNLKQEKGAISIIVIVTMLFITGILTGVYMTSANRYKTQMQISDEMKNLYEKNVEQVADVYETFQNEKLYIYTKEQLLEFRDRVNSGISYQGKNVYLMNDIDLNEGKYTVANDGTVTFAQDAEQWTPIGTDSYKFNGTFDGLNHKISGLYINANEDNVALFRYINNGTLQNLGLENSYIKNDSSKIVTGGLVAQISNSKVINCYNRANIDGGKNSGGITPYANGSSVIEKCYNTGNINSNNNQFAAGIVSYIEKDVVIKKCFNEGIISRTQFRRNSWRTKRKLL